MTNRCSIVSTSRALAMFISLFVCACQVYTPYTFALNPEYHTYTKRVKKGTAIFIEQIGILPDIARKVPVHELLETVGPGYSHLNPPPEYTGWKDNRSPDKYGDVWPVGITEYLKVECRLAGFEVLEEKSSDERALMGWCGLKRNQVSELKGGRHLVRFYLHKRITRMDVEWVCGLREGKRALWERSYFGTGEAEYNDSMYGFATMDMEHRAYSQAIGPIVKAYVEDLVQHFNPPE